MKPFEFVAGVLMLLSCAVVIWIVLSQGSKGQGLSGVITGVDTASGDTRGRTKEARQSKITKISAIILFALTIITNVVSAWTA